MYRNRTIEHNQTLLNALKKMDMLGKKLLIVLHNDKFVGLVSIGDIQRAIIQNKPLDTKVSEILRSNIRIATPHDDFDSIRKMMLEFRMELCPVVDSNREIVNVYYWEEIFQERKTTPQNTFNLPVVIMAGGFGTRLKPITNVLPKPLIPLGEKTMLEEIFCRFSEYGCNRFLLSLNYKADLIKYYLKSLDLPYTIEFFEETKPLGTAGSLNLLRDSISETFFVTNCDILIEEDYAEILKYHRQQQNEITLVAALKHFSLPYGTLQTGENGRLLSLQEKPEFTFKINSGMYILEPQLLREIPANELFHITQLIENVLQRNGNVGVFPVSEKSWKDVGDWDVYLKTYIRGENNKN